MIYIGHFSFMKNPVDGDENQANHGYFTTVAEGDSVETALEKFDALIRKLYQDGEVFENVDEVFLDACIECKEIPSAGFLAHYVEWLGEDNDCISTSVIGASEDQVADYYIESDEQDEDGESFNIEPFIVFED